MREFTPELTSALNRAEGSISFRYTLDEPLARGSHKAAPLLVTPPDSPVVARIETGPGLQLTFLHAPEAQPPRVARIDIDELAGAKSLQIYLTWSPAEVCLYVGSRELGSPLLQGTSGA